MSKQSRARRQLKKKNTKSVANLSRVQARTALELAAARAQLSRDVPLIDQLLSDVRSFAHHVLTMENRLNRTIAHLETGACIADTGMTRDEYIMALQNELKKITVYKADTMNPLMRKMAETYEIKDSAERILGEVEMQVMLEESLMIFTKLSEEVHENTKKLDLQKALAIEETPIEEQIQPEGENIVVAESNTVCSTEETSV